MYRKWTEADFDMGWNHEFTPAMAEIVKRHGGRLALCWFDDRIESDERFYGFDVLACLDDQDAEEAMRADLAAVGFENGHIGTSVEYANLAEGRMLNFEAFVKRTYPDITVETE